MSGIYALSILILLFIFPFLERLSQGHAVPSDPLLATNSLITV